MPSLFSSLPRPLTRLIATSLWFLVRRSYEAIEGAAQHRILRGKDLALDLLVGYGCSALETSIRHPKPQEICAYVDYVDRSFQFWAERLFSSYTISGALALCLAWGLTYLLLPRLWGYLPKDGGRQFAIDADKSIGKPLSAGIIIIAVFTIVVLVVTPFKSKIVMCLPLGIAACIVGFVDDNKRGGMSEWTLGIADLIVALLTAFIISGFEPAQIWFPIYANTFTAPAWIAIPVMTGVIWLAINAMNCTDGVDGLSANLACITLAALAGLLYIVIGNQEVAHYLHVPHNPAAADWAMTAFTMLGCLFGYLWYNAPPSVVLMGDSGSRPIGWLIGTLVVVSGNPTILFVCGLVIILNGATGLAKVLLIRIFDIPILSDIRFPLHDHARKNLGWAGTQVLMRFSLIHLAVTVLLLTFLLKIR